jgi:hypothetical protein
MDTTMEKAKQEKAAAVEKAVKEALEADAKARAKLEAEAKAAAQEPAARRRRTRRLTGMFAASSDTFQEESFMSEIQPPWANRPSHRSISWPVSFCWWGGS